MKAFALEEYDFKAVDGIYPTSYVYTCLGGMRRRRMRMRMSRKLLAK
jgi:hypothetical protein